MNEDTLLGAGKEAYDKAKAKLTELEGQEQTLRNQYEASLAQDPVEPNGNHIPSAATQAIENQLKAKEGEVFVQAIRVNDFVKVWQATKGAVSVGNTGLAATRQITNVAAGKEDTDAVNVAQLKKVAAMAGSATVDMEAGNNVTVTKDTNTGKYKIAAADTTLKQDTNALSLSNGKLKLSLEDTKGNKVTGSVDLNTIQGAAGAGKTYTMTGTEDSANNTTTIALKDNNGNEQKVTVATKDTNTYTTEATYDAGSKKLTFKRNDNKTYDVDLSGIAGSVTGDTRNTITESDTIAVDDTNKNADGSINYTLNVKTKGEVKQGDKSIVSGGTVYKETRVQKDGKYVKKDKTAGDNLSALDKQVGINAKDINALGKKVDVNTGNINKNKEDINILGKKVDINTGNISKNKEGINALGKEVGINKENINKNTETINILGTQVGSLDTRVDKVGAGAAALAGLHPLDYDPENKWDFAAGYGNYNGANAIAIGAFYRPDENKMISIGGSFGGGENMVSAGISVKVGQGTGISTSKAAMANEIRELKARDREREAQMQEIMRQLEILQKQAGK
ncbi:MAG: YadA-like family protein [Dialister sp.]